MSRKFKRDGSVLSGARACLPDIRGQSLKVSSKSRESGSEQTEKDQSKNKVFPGSEQNRCHIHEYEDKFRARALVFTSGVRALRKARLSSL